MAVGLVGRRFDAYGRGQRTDTGATPTIVLVAAEDPRVQDAGHSQFLAGFLRHFQALGCRVVLLVTTGRVGFLAASAAAGYEVRSPGTVRVGRFTVARPKAALRHLAWLTFVGAPAPAQRAVDGVRSWWRGRRTVDHVLGHPVEGELARWVNTELEALAPDAVLFNTLFSVPDPLALPAGASGHIITVDVMSERAAAFARIGYGVHPPNFGADDEAAALARLPHLIAIQWDDAAHFRALLPDATVVVAPVVVDAGPVPIRTPIPGRCVFVGSGALHNVDGIRWFIAECWPAIRAGRPDAELHVIGTVCARLGAAPPGVVLRGRVDDLAPEYAAAAAVVVPLRAGSGLKVKLVDALCHGVPVVTTPTGAQGLMAIEPPPFEVAEDPDAFAAAVERVLADPSWGQELERRAATVASRFSSDEAFRELDDDLRSRGVRLPAPETGMNP